MSERKNCSVGFRITSVPCTVFQCTGYSHFPGVMAGVLFLSGVFSTTTAADFPQIQPILKSHCISCHGPERQKGNLRLDTLTGDFTNSREAAAWIEVRDRINLGEMPPEDEPQLNAEQQLQVSNWIAAELKAVHARANSTGGKVQMRRLSRSEYINTVRDLLKVTFHEGDSPREILPPDGTLEGFDKLSKALLLDPSLMENYFQAANLVADRAIRTLPDPVPSMKVRYEFEQTRDPQRWSKNTEDGLILYNRYAKPVFGKELKHPYADILDAPGAIPIRGRYTVRVRAGADRGNRPDDPVYMDVKGASPTNVVTDVSRIGRNRRAPASRQASIKLRPSRPRRLMKSTMTRESFTTTPASANIPKIER